MPAIEHNWPSPFVDNVSDEEEVYNRLLLVTGRAGPVNCSFDGSISVETHCDNREAGEARFPGQTWPVTDSYFKALVPLSPGRNVIRFLFTAPDSLHGQSRNDTGTTITVNYVPLVQNPPLHLVILTASDSPLTVDCPPDRRDRDGHLDAVIAKLQLWAYMCQAFTAESSRRNGLGRRTFALDEQRGPDSLESYPPMQQRRRPVVHVLRSRHSRAEFLDPNNAQQNKQARRAGAMHEFATEALNDPSAPPQFRNPSGAYVAVLTLDAHWDPAQKLLLGHAALGAGGPVGPGCKIGVFGSHSCWSWPRSLPEVVSAFMDCTEVDERHCVNDLGNIGTAWETLNVGHGAFIHEVGHALNNPHHRTGIMARGYHEWNRAFMTNEGCSKRTKTDCCRPITPQMDDKENHWNRMSLIRLRYHPTMRLPRDPYIPYHYAAMAPTFAITKEGVSVHAPVGLASIEIQVNGTYVNHLEYPFASHDAPPPPQDVQLTTRQIADLASADPKNTKISVTAVGTDQRQAEIEDYGQLCKESRMIVKTSPEGPAPPIPTASAGGKFKRAFNKLANKDGHHAEIVPHPGHGVKPGDGEMEIIKGISVGQEKRENTFITVLHGFQGGRPKLVRIEIYSGLALDGFKLFWSDGSKQTIGPCGGGSSKSFKVEPPSKIVRLKVRSGAWMDAVSIAHEHGETPLCGGGGGDLRVLEPPPGSEICGFFGSSGAWLNSLGLLYTA